MLATLMQITQCLFYVSEGPWTKRHASPLMISDKVCHIVPWVPTCPIEFN